MAGLLSLVVLSTGGWGWYLGEVAQASVSRTDAIPTSGNVESTEARRAGAAMNLLLVGNDSRADLTDAQLAELNAGEDAGMNTDTIILVHVPADGSGASFVSFPRDSYVEIPGYGEDKLNAAYAYGYAGVPSTAPEEQRMAGGAQLLVRTISQLTGLQIDHYAEVDLLGFFDLTSVVGGVDVNLCAAVDDSYYSGAVFPAGPQTIGGADALKFVRQRHELPRGDFDRIIRQQVFIAGVLRKMLSEDVLLDPGKQSELVAAAADSLTIDQGMDLIGLAEQMQDVTPGTIDFQTVPFVGDAEDEDGRYILQLEEVPALHAFFAELSADGATSSTTSGTVTTTVEQPPAPLSPSQVRVGVYNGSGVSGVAARAGTDLTAGGFVVLTTGNADAGPHPVTQVLHAAGDEQAAAAVAATVPGSVAVVSEDATPGTVQLVLGTDFNGVGRPVTAAAEPAAVVAGEDARTAADTTCIN
ncbi:LCP family protein [Goekera deserti]|uniref:LCP family protein n=1 Tax=Goekera deserti TaxID=2497753 RepID=UPI001F16802F|nr:LCP family protein [Goekera deserti]